MILVVGSSSDKVVPRLNAYLEDKGYSYLFVDEDRAEQYEVERIDGSAGPEFHLRGGCCDGCTPVGVVFVRHAVARTLDPAKLMQLSMFQLELNRMLLAARITIINPPNNAQSNYSKPLQVVLLAQAGFDVPRTLVTNAPEAARRFYDQCAERVVFKGVSNVMTLAQLLGPDNLDRLELLPNSPTLFQEYVEGVDYRVHVIGVEAIVTRLIAKDTDYRRSALASDPDVRVEPACLPKQVLEKCVSVTRQLGLVVSGIDFKETTQGRLVVLELNPYPQFTFYEGRSGQPLTSKVVEYLVAHQREETNVFA